MMNDFIQQIIQPLAGLPCGEDPRYSDNFAMIKQEMEKLGEIDYATIYENCKTILFTEAKDLRVAGFMLLAATYVDGISGLITALQSYQALISAFGEAIHPQRDTARHAALQWLNNPRLLMFAEKSSDLGRENIEKLQTTVTELNQTIKQHAGETAPRLSILDEWLKKQLIQTTPVVPATANEQQSAPPPTAAVPTEINTEECAKQIINKALDSNSYTTATAFARALRWSDLCLPHHESYKTRIPAPREAGLNKLTHLVTTDNPKNLYLHCEELFLEPGGHLLLDLQYHAATAARDMAQPELEILIETEITGLIKRLPELAELQFANSTPFANSETKSWLTNISQATENSSSQANNVTADIGEIISAAKEQVKGKNLKGWLLFINQLPKNNAQEKFHHHRAIARLCLDNKRADLALPLLESLAVQIEQHNLIAWQPEIALSVWQELYRALTLQLKKANEPVKLELSQRAEAIFNLICQHNISDIFNL
ncbi:MAG: type VI secretion system domain-containing protein [Gammaproteobacteria bacterium]|nr:type VI secretion system domain-containing protein [Gammaproteobacteria bacterium]